MDRDFEGILRQVSDSEEQKALENRDVNARYKALGLGLLFGILVLITSVSALTGTSWWITGVLGVIAAMVLGVWDRATVQSILTAKEQDRRYFLSCIRKAQNINELNRAGLCAYMQYSGGPAWVAQVKVDVENLKKALEAEPEWLK